MKSWADIGKKVGEKMPQSDVFCCSRQNSTDGSSLPLLGRCIRVTIIRRRKPSDGAPSPQERRKRAKSYERIFRRESEFFCRTIRDPSEIGNKLMSRDCLEFDDLTTIESHPALGDQTRVLIDIVTRKDCFIELYEVLLEEESPLVDYLEIKSNTNQYVNDGEFVKRLGLKAFLTENDRKVLKRYYRYITRETNDAEILFTHLLEKEILDDRTFEYLQHMPCEIKKMEYFVQTNMSRWTYEELKRFCEILVNGDDTSNDHVAKVLWPIVRTADPTAGSLTTEPCDSDTTEILSLDTKAESSAYKFLKSSSIHRQTSVVLGNHGLICDVTHGSIRVTMVLQTLDAVRQLKEDLDHGCLQDRFKTWVQSNAKVDLAGSVVRAQLDEAGMRRAEKTLSEHFGKLSQKGILTDSVQFGYCKERGQWFWSHDGDLWVHISRLRVPVGDQEGLVPREEDVQIIQMLAKQQVPVKHPVSPCPVCTMGKFSVQYENIHAELRQYESLHSGVEVSITFSIYKRQSPTVGEIVNKSQPQRSHHNSSLPNSPARVHQSIRKHNESSIYNSTNTVSSSPHIENKKVPCDSLYESQSDKQDDLVNVDFKLMPKYDTNPTANVNKTGATDRVRVRQSEPAIPTVMDNQTGVQRWSAFTGRETSV